MEICLEDIESFEFIELSDVYDINVKDNHNYHLANDILVHNSSKTYSLCQLIIIYALQNDNKVISIVRKTFPALRATVMRDFFEVLNNFGLYNKKNHNKSEHIYYFDNGSQIEFFSVDDEQKVRGRKRDVCWANEANELWYDDFNQLNLRTSTAFILDYNPSENYSWLYELPKEDQVFIQSTYKDNPFLPQSIISQIENLINTDESLYKIYALGERAATKQNIFTNWTFIDEKPEKFKTFVYGLDFGYSHPTALVKVWFNENELFIEEVIYESYLTSADLIKKMDDLGVDKNIEIIADYARPEMIAELQRAGYYLLNADKSVQKGLNIVKTYKVFVDDKANNIKKEYENYSYKKIKDIITDEPIKLWDDAIDGCRYAIVYLHTTYGQTSGGSDVFSFSR